MFFEGTMVRGLGFVQIRTVVGHLERVLPGQGRGMVLVVLALLLGGGLSLALENIKVMVAHGSEVLGWLGM